MIRTRSLTAALVGIALAVAACGGSDDDSDDNATGGGASSSASSEVQWPDLSGQTVEVAAVWTGAEQANFEEVLKGFKEKTKANYKFTSTGDDIATVLGTRIKGGNPPDVSVLPQPGLLKQLAGQKALTPLDAETTKQIDANYAPIWKELGTVDGQVYGVWWKGANKSTVWYRTQAFEDAGISEPATWEDFTKALGTLSDAGSTPLSIGGGDGWTLTDWFENVYLRVAGPEKYDQLSKHEIKYTDPTVVETLKQLALVWDKKYQAPNALTTDYPTSVSQTFADPPKAAIVYEGDFAATTITDETKAKLGEDAKFFTFPSINGSKPSVVGGGDVAVVTKKTEAAQALVKYLATPDAAAIIAKKGGFTSANKSLDTSVYPNEIAKKSAEDLVGAGDNFRFDMSDLAPAAFGGTPGKGEWKILQDYLANPTNPEATASKLETEAAKAFGS